MTVRFAVVVYGLCLVFYAGVSALIALWTDRNLDFWISYFKEESVDVAYWKAFLLTFLVPGVTWGGNVIAEIIRCCV